MKLAEVRERVSADDAGKWDRVIERGDLRLQDGRLRLPRSCRSDNAAAAKGLRLTHWATAQMCQRLGIPTAYYRRCPVPLQDMQVNHWLHRTQEGEGATENGRWLLRSKGDTLRGVLSERYARLNNRDVLECLLPVVAEVWFEVEWFAVTEESLHLRLYDPRLSRDVLPGDRVMAGLHVGNSEVGKRAVTVDALVYRLVCKNGLVRLVKGKSLLHHRHLGFGKAALQAGLGTAVRQALVQSTGFMERMHQATREYVPDIGEVISVITGEANLSRKTAEEVKAALGREPRFQQETLYGLVNAFTFVAQALAPDDRYTLETLAGRLLESGAPRKKAASSGEVVTASAPLAGSAPLPTLFGPA